MTNWKKGDIAICVKVGKITEKQGIPPKLRLKAEYIVQGVKQCGCGNITLDVGLPSITGIIICNLCDRTTTNEDVGWCSASRFVKKDTRSKEEQIKEAVANEDYELADKLLNNKI